MEIWSDGKETVVFDDAGLTFFDGEEVRELSSPGGDALTLGPRKGLYSTTEKIFAVDPAARTALVGTSGEIPLFIDLNRTSLPTKLGFRWVAAAFVGNGEYFAVLPEDEKFYYRFVKLGSRGNVLDEVEAECPPPIDVEAAPLLFERAPGPLTPLGTPLEAKGPFAIQRNRFGLAVADSGTGVVLYAKAGERNFCGAVRFAVQKDDTLLAAPLANGFCVSGSIRENHSTLVSSTKLGTSSMK